MLTEREELEQIIAALPPGAYLERQGPNLDLGVRLVTTPDPATAVDEEGNEYPLPVMPAAWLTFAEFKARFVS